LSACQISSFSYEFFSKAFDDEVFKVFLSKTLPSLTNLRNFQLFVPNSTVTDSSVKKLFGSFPKEWFSTLNQFRVGFDNTKITDQSLEVFIYDILFKLRAMEEFSLHCDNSGISDDLKGKISRWEKIFSEDLS